MCAVVRRGRVALGIDVLTTLRTPVLMVWGDHDVFLTPTGARVSIEAMPDVRVLRLDAGHGPWLEHPDTVGGEVRDFLA